MTPNLDRARYLLELGCQAAEYSACFDLLFAYRNEEWKEPVEGRGRAIARFVCDTWPKSIDCVMGEPTLPKRRR